MSNPDEILYSAAINALQALRSNDAGLREQVAGELEKALLNQRAWCLVKPDSMPPERIRVIGCVGTLVYEDCFFGYGSSPRAPAHEHKLWRDTRNEAPLAYVPTMWMRLAPTPSACPFATGLPVVIQEVPAENALTTALA